MSDEAALDAARTLARLEGIIPALESAHALAELIARAPRMCRDEMVIFNLSGRGDKDMDIRRATCDARELHSSADNSGDDAHRAALRGASAAQGEMGLVAFLTAGDPSLAATESLVLALAEAGADVIELGVPFSDPVADGPAIQRSSERALRAGTTLAGVLDLVASIRRKSDVALVLFSYYNPVLQMGLERFAETRRRRRASTAC